MKESQISAITFYEILFTVLAVVMFMLFGVAPLRGFGLVFATMVFSLAAIAQSFIQLRHGAWISLAFLVVCFSIFGITLVNMPYYV